MSDDFFNQFDPPRPPRPEFTAALYQRINQPVKTSPRTRVLRAAALSFAMVAVIAGVLFLLPSTRALADAIIRQFQKGNNTIQMVNDAPAASQLAGFTALAPSYLPDGYTPYNQPGEWSVIHENGGVMAVITYHNQAANGDLAITEQVIRQEEPNSLMKNQEAQDLTVRGQPGKWLSNGKSILAWDENGISYIISTNALPKNEMLKVADSLSK